MAVNEKERVSTQARDLGAEGLKRKKEELEQAMAKNEVGNSGFHTGFSFGRRRWGEGGVYLSGICFSQVFLYEGPRESGG